MLFDPLHTITWFLLVKSTNRPYFSQQIMLPNLDTLMVRNIKH
jgi:hypothetical protein